MYTNTIFLDIDGVLNCDTSKSRCGIFLGIDKDKVQRLARVVKETDAALVLTSTWRLDWIPNHAYREHIDIHSQRYAGKYLRNHLWRKGGLVAEDATDDLLHYGTWRDKEILHYLETHPDIKNYVILDDEFFWGFDVPKIWRHLVLTDPKVGFTDADADTAIMILQGQLNDKLNRETAQEIIENHSPNLFNWRKT